MLATHCLEIISSETVRGMGNAVNEAVIVGGGLGGLAAAIHLRKRGIDAQIYEKNASISGGEGTLISLFPNGFRALIEADAGIVSKFKNEGLPNLEAKVITKDGQIVGGWSLSQRMEELYKQPMVAILWKNALKILSESLPDDCKHTGYECKGITQDNDGATVHFKHGESSISVKAPLVIGADGIRSSVRTALFGPIPPRDNGRTMWRAVMDADLCSHELLKVGNLSAASEGRTIFIVNGVKGKLYWAFSITDEASSDLTKIRSQNPQEMKERLLEAYQGWELASHIIQATDPELILERRVVDLPVLPKWSQGSVILLGDAAHAVTPALGQGANLAFEDASELGVQLSSSPDLRSALENFESIRIPRASVVSQKSQAGGGGQSQEFYDWLYNYDPHGTS